MQIYPLQDPYALKRDGSTPLTADWDAGGFKITAESLVLTGLTASRLVQTDADVAMVSVEDLTDWIAGTANQITATDDEDGTMTLSLPQDIDTSADVAFNTVLTTGNVSCYDVEATFLASGSYYITMSNPAGALERVDDLTDFIADSGGGNMVIADDGSGGVTLNTAQDIDTGDSPTFVGLTLSGAIATPTNITASGTVQAEQLTSTDDITMQGHLFTLGDGTANDVVLSFNCSANDGTLTYDESEDRFDFGGSQVYTGNNAFYSTGFYLYNDVTTGILFGSGYFYFQQSNIVLARFAAGKNPNVTINYDAANVDFKWLDDAGTTMLACDAGLSVIRIGDGGVTNYAEFSNTGNLTLNGSAILDHSNVPNKPKIYSQADEPDIPNDTTAYWTDTDDGKYYLILDIGGTQKKVELT